MKISIRHYNVRTIKATLLAALLLVSSSIALLAQSPIQKPPTLELRPVGFSNLVTKTKSFEIQLTPALLTSSGGLTSVNGTGSLKLDGTLVITSGCCARIRVELMRTTTADIFAHRPAVVFREKVVEVCGSKAVSFNENLNASQDDARFFVRLTNLDSWNKVTVNANFTLTFPTGDVILTAQPNIPIDLTRGVDVSRTFRLSPNTAGKLKIEIRWTGAASLQARLFRPGQQPGPSGGVLTQTASSGALDLSYNITPSDIAAGDQWAINVLNNSATSVTATGITFRVIYTVQE